MTLATNLAAQLAASIGSPLSGFEPTPADYPAVLGANLKALWHQAHGVTEAGGVVSSWADYVGAVTPTLNTITGTDNVLYQADGSAFRAKPVLHFGLTSSILTKAAISVMPTNQRPYMFTVFRIAALDSTNARAFIWNAAGRRCAVQLDASLNLDGVIQTSAALRTANGPAATTSQTFAECWHDGSNVLLRLNGGTPIVGDADTADVDQAFTRVDIGGSPFGGSDTALHGAIALVGICQAAPSAAEMSALAALIAADFGG